MRSFIIVGHMFNSKLRTKLFSGEPSRDARPFVVEQLKRLGGQACGLSLVERTGQRGNDIAIEMTAILVHHSSWIRKGREPVLHELLEVAFDLDRDSGSQEDWHKLFSLLDCLD